MVELKIINSIGVTIEKNKEHLLEFKLSDVLILINIYVNSLYNLDVEAFHNWLPFRYLRTIKLGIELNNIFFDMKLLYSRIILDKRGKPNLNE